MDVRRSLENLHHASGDRYQIRVWFIAKDRLEVGRRLRNFAYAVTVRGDKARHVGFSPNGSPLLELIQRPQAVKEGRRN